MTTSLNEQTMDCDRRLQTRSRKLNRPKSWSMDLASSSLLSMKKRNWIKTRHSLIYIDLFICIFLLTKLIFVWCFLRFLSMLLLDQRKRKIRQRPIRPLHQFKRLLLLSTLLKAFHRSEKTVSLPVVSSRDSSSAAISSDSLTL